MKIPRYGFAVLFGLALLLFTGYLLADTFLIKRVYSVAAEPASQTAAAQTAAESDEIVIVASEEEAAAEPVDSSPAAEPVTTDTTYSDENISVQLSTYRLYETTVYVADVQLSSADYLKTAFAENSYGRNITAKTSATASAVNAILAINGDYYGAQRSGYVIRNGVL